MVGYRIRYELGLLASLYIRAARMIGHGRHEEPSFAVVTRVRILNATDPDTPLQPTPYLLLHLQEVVFSLDGLSFPVRAGKQDCMQAIDNLPDFQGSSPLTVLP